MKHAGRILLAALIVSPLSVWAGFRHCYWINVGWCADLTPILVWIQAPIFALILCFVLWLLMYSLGHMAKTGELALLGGAGLIVAGAAFYCFETRRAELIGAISRADESGVKRWLALGASPNARAHKGGAPALYLAIEAKSTLLVKTLLEAGANPNPVGECNIYLPLFKAYQEGDRDAVAALRAKGAKDPCPELQRNLVLGHGVEPREFKNYPSGAPTSDEIKLLSKVHIFNVVVDNARKSAYLQFENQLEDPIVVLKAELAFNGKRALEIRDLELATTEVKTVPIDYESVDQACKKREGTCLVEMTTESFPAWRPFTVDALDESEVRRALHVHSLCLKNWKFSATQTSFVELINFSEEPITLGELAIAVTLPQNTHPSFSLPGKHVFPPKQVVRLEIPPAKYPDWLAGQLERAKEKTHALKIQCSKWGPGHCPSAPDVLDVSPNRCAWVR